MRTLTHITDVGAPAHEGSDSTERIHKQYARLGVEVPRVVSAGHSPLHVAFTACTDSAAQAKDNAAAALALIGLESPAPLPVALNSAPRNSEHTLPDSKEDHIFRVAYEGGERFLIYGPEVLKWVLTFRGQVAATVERIVSIGDIITDTSRGSQFRSCEHLPIAHVLDAHGKLDDYSLRELIDEVDVMTPPEGQLVVLPPDEYGNGRLLAERPLFDEILRQDLLRVAELDSPLVVRPSLTDVVPFSRSRHLSVWPSSNHFPGEKFGVLNVGTRWEAGHTKNDNPAVLQLVGRFKKEVGRLYQVIPN